MRLSRLCLSLRGKNQDTAAKRAYERHFAGTTKEFTIWEAKIYEAGMDDIVCAL
jgi:hypothetical protein